MSEQGESGRDNRYGRGRFRCGDWELDLGRGILLRNGAEQPLSPKVRALLTYLLAHRDRVVPGQELLDAVWSDAVVSEATLASTLRAVRAALGEPARGGCIRTLRGRGYRFVGDLEERIPAPLRHLAGSFSSSSGAALEAPFVGRGDVLAAGAEAAGAARAGRTRALLLAGEAGIGKSRGLFELTRAARESGFDIHVGRCLEEEGAPACWPWVQIVRGVLAAVPEAKRDAVIARHSEAFALLPELRGERASPPAADVGGATARFRLFDAVVGLLREAAEDAPRALVLDDLHRADATTALLLRHLLATLTDAPLLLLGALRDREVPVAHPIGSVLAELHGAGCLLELSRLDSEEVGQILAALSGRSASPETSAALREHTGGNPLFVCEIARSLRRDEARDPSQAALGSAPRSLRQMIRARVDRLPDDAGPVLEAASVLGREFEIEDLRGLLRDETGADVDAGIDAAVAAELLTETAVGSARLRFSHILVRDVLYAGLGHERRCALHRDAGRVLEAHHAIDLDVHADVLAHHFEQAAERGEAERAQRYAALAAQGAIENAAYAEAASRAEAALRALALRAREERALPGDEALRQRAVLLALLGRARWLGGETERARECFAEASRLAAEVDAPEIQARAALGYAGRTDVTPGVNLGAVSLMEAALGRLPVADAPLRAELLARLGTELYRADATRCDTLTHEALAMAERCGDAALHAYALSARHFALLRPDVDPRRRLALTTRLEALAAASGARDVLGVGLISRSVDLIELGDIVGLDRTIGELDALAGELRQPFFLWMASAHRGMRALLDGRVGDAERLAQETLALGRGFGSPNALPLYSGQLFCVRREQGRLRELEPVLRSALEAEPVFLVLRAGLAAIQTAAGRPLDARDSLAAVMSGDFDSLPRDDGWLGILSLLASTAVQVGDVARMQQLFELLAPHSGRLIAIGHGSVCDGAVDHHLGLLAAGVGDVDAADAHLEAAATLHRRAGARLWLAHTQRERAALLWKTGASHERQQARALAEQAVATYAALDLEHWRRRTLRALG